MKHYALIYKMTHKKTGHFYIGCTKKTLEERIYRHTYMAKSKYPRMKVSHFIARHKVKDFAWETLLVFPKESDQWQDVHFFERFFIEKFKNKNKQKCLNIADGSINKFAYETMRKRYRRKLKLKN